MLKFSSSVGIRIPPSEEALLQRSSTAASAFLIQLRLLAPRKKCHLAVVAEKLPPRKLEFFVGAVQSPPLYLVKCSTD
ncbi:hypothetical protein [Pueribacillus theae]|uniref:hypothetical protein n=1 Tax=Pueribacillus theae TaxID=2171751 RepID=UPI0019813DCB|nr:hypothetical protein [Pueribacillus theae]